MEQVKYIDVFCDGGARGNPGPAAIGVVIKTKQGQVLSRLGKKIGIATNNIAEYTAVIEALSWLVDNRRLFAGSIQVRFYLDSQLVVSQLNGVFKVKHPNIRALVMRVREKEGELGGAISYTHIPREENSQADTLLNKALDE